MKFPQMSVVSVELSMKGLGCNPIGSRKSVADIHLHRSALSITRLLIGWISCQLQIYRNTNTTMHRLRKENPLEGQRSKVMKGGEEWVMEGGGAGKTPLRFKLQHHLQQVEELTMIF